MEERLAKRDLHCPVCRAAVEATFLVCPVCTTRLKQACVKCNEPARGALADLPALRDAGLDAEPARDRRARSPTPGRLPASAPQRTSRHPRPMAVERTLILIKPDATERALAGEILARIERRGFTVVGGKLLSVSRDARQGALRRAQREAVLRRARRLHHLGADVGARGRGRGRDRDDAEDDRARRIPPTPSPARSAATSRRRCRTTSSTAPTRPSRRSARSRSGSPTMSSSELTDTRS